MIKKLFQGLLVLTALLNSPSAFADEMPQSQMSVEFGSIPVVQPLPQPNTSLRIKRGEVCPPIPAPTDPWPTEGVSLVGGCQSTSAQQYAYAKSRGLPSARNEAEFQILLANGTFVPIEAGPFLQVLAKRPYARPETVRMVYELAPQYTAAGCGKLTVTDAARLTSEVYKGSSPDSVHPFGMAVDLRLRFITPVCADWLRAKGRDFEAQKRSDVTEHGTDDDTSPVKLHLHWVEIAPDQEVQFAHMR